MNNKIIKYMNLMFIPKKSNPNLSEPENNKIRKNKKLFIEDSDNVILFLIKSLESVLIIIYD